MEALSHSGSDGGWDQVSLSFPEEMPELSPGGFARGEEESEAPLVRDASRESQLRPTAVMG